MSVVERDRFWALFGSLNSRPSFKLSNIDTTYLLLLDLAQHYPLPTTLLIETKTVKKPPKGAVYQSRP